MVLCYLFAIDPYSALMLICVTLAYWIMSNCFNLHKTSAVVQNSHKLRGVHTQLSVSVVQLFNSEATDFC